MSPVTGGDHVTGTLIPWLSIINFPQHRNTPVDPLPARLFFYESKIYSLDRA
jgi:hypothetical protein